MVLKQKLKIDQRKPEEKEEENETQVSSSSNNDLSDELTKLNDLKEKGIISQEEFEKAKNKLLNN